jgi:hypothetical protein
MFDKERYLPKTVRNIYLVEKPGSRVPVVIVENSEIAIEQMKEISARWKQADSLTRDDLKIYRLHVHKTIQLKFVHHLKKQLPTTRLGNMQVAYAVVPGNPHYDRHYYHLSFHSFTPYWGNKGLYPKEHYQMWAEIDKVAEVSQANGDYLVNRKLVKPDQLADHLKSTLAKEPFTVFKYYPDYEGPFADYLHVLMRTKAAVDDLRDEYARSQYPSFFAHLREDKQAQIRAKFPQPLLEMTPELVQQFEQA